MKIRYTDKANEFPYIVAQSTLTVNGYTTKIGCVKYKKPLFYKGFLEHIP